MARKCLRCATPIPDVPQNRTRKRCEPCATEHHAERSSALRSEKRRERWGAPRVCPCCGTSFYEEQRPGAPSRYCPSCRAVKNFGKRTP